MTRLKELSESVRNAQAEVKKGAAAAFADAFAKFFEDFPEVLKIQWTQGTPGFNDGDPCHFSRHDLNLCFEPTVKAFLQTGLTLDEAIVQASQGQKVPVDEDEDDDFEGDYNLMTQVPNTEKLTYKQIHPASSWGADYVPDFVDRKGPAGSRAAALDAAYQEFYGASEDLYEAAFGDGVKVTASRKGIDTEEHYCE